MHVLLVLRAMHVLEMCACVCVHTSHVHIYSIPGPCQQNAHQLNLSLYLYCGCTYVCMYAVEFALFTFATAFALSAKYSEFICVFLF